MEKYGKAYVQHKTNLQKIICTTSHPNKKGRGILIELRATNAVERTKFKFTVAEVSIPTQAPVLHTQHVEASDGSLASLFH